MNIAESKTRSAYPLSKRKIIKKTIVGVFVWALLTLLGGAASLIFNLAITTDPTIPSEVVALGPLVSNAWWVLLVLFVLLSVLTYFYQVWYFAAYYYELADHFLIIRKHPITPTEINVPYERFQDVYVDQDILDRIMGLYDVHISSATITSGMEAHIDGMEKVAAMGLRDELLNIVKKKVSKDQKEA